MSASKRLLKTCHHPKVPVTAPFLLLLDEINCVCVVFKKCRFCHGNKAVQRREARQSPPFCSPLSCEFICSFLAGW